MWRRRDGFTFLELAVVVVIIGIMMTITAPRFSSSLSKATVGATARRLAGTMEYLRNKAAKDGRSYFLNLNLDSKEYFVTVIKEKGEASQPESQDSDILDEQSGLVYREVKDAFTSRTKLEKKISFASILLGDGTPVFEGSVRIEFRPDGTADEVAIYLTNPRQKVYTVHLEQYNGQARVYKNAYVLEPPPQLTERKPPEDRSDAL